MQKYIIFALFMLVTFGIQAQSKKEMNKRIQAIEDKMALKAIVDEFSNLADTKDVAAQVLLFTEDAEVISVVDGVANPPLKGRKQIADAFAPFLALFETVYHLNGQQTVEINGDKATAISYCLVTLIANDKGKKTKTTMAIHYNDEFVRINNKWFIAKRRSIFDWREVQPMN